MPCIELRGRVRCSVRWIGLAAPFTVLVLAGCAADRTAPPAPVATARPVAVPAATVAAAVEQKPAAPRTAEPKPAARPAAAATAAVRLPAPGPVRQSNELHLQAALRIAAANPNLIYTEPTPDVLLAIPVLAVDLNADGSIRRIEVLRYPRQAKDTTQIAIDAVRRAAPFGDVSRLPRPWRYIETFLFNDARRFKPRTLDTQ